MGKTQGDAPTSSTGSHLVVVRRLTRFRKPQGSGMAVAFYGCGHPGLGMKRARGPRGSHRGRGKTGYSIDPPGQ